MFLLIPALLLAAWLLQPWAYADVPGDALFAHARAAANVSQTGPLVTDDPDILYLKALRTRATLAEGRSGEPGLEPPPPAPAPAQTPAPSPAPVPAQLPPDGLEALVCSYPWPCEEALAVARCESGVDRSGRLDGAFARSGSNYGLFQINAIHAWRWAGFWTSWMDPAQNAQWAFELWSEQGWRPWACRP